MKTPDVETALRIYYEYTEIGNAEITQLFASVSSATAAKLKKAARMVMVEKGVHTVFPKNVNTKIAYEAWGLDVEEMERRYKRLKTLGLKTELSRKAFK